MSIPQIARGDTHHHALIWISARNRLTDGVETAGFWTGGEDRAFTVEGEARSYFGIGHVLDVPPILSSEGGVVQMQQLRLSANSPEIEAALRGYDVRQAPIDIHVARFDPATGALAGIDRAFRGFVDKAPRTIPAKNGDGSEWALDLASSMRSLTRALTVMRSDASQRVRLLPDGRPDRFFRHATVAGSVERFWGTVRVTPQATPQFPLLGGWGGDGSFGGGS